MVKPINISPNLIKNSLNTNFFQNFLFYEETDSTNIRAFEDGSICNGIFIAESQTSGKGRKNRPWISPPNLNIYISLKLFIDKIEQSRDIFFIVSTTLSEILKNIYNIDIEIKWPNDIIKDGKKIAGILTEIGNSKDQYFTIIGVGLNCNQIKFPKFLKNIATSIALENKTIDRNYLIINFLNLFIKNYNTYISKGIDKFIDQWFEYSKILDRQIVTEINGCKEVVTVVKMDKDGSLYLKRGDNSIYKQIVGDIEYVNTDNY